jgi:hypothetical protein
MCLQKVLRDNLTSKTLSNFVLANVLLYHQITLKEFCKYVSSKHNFLSQIEIKNSYVFRLAR